MSDVIAEIAEERKRQIEVEGWTPENDDQHDGGQMARAASCYAFHATGPSDIYTDLGPPTIWPWHLNWWKPKNPRRDLIRAAALIVAEIERIDRAEAAETVLQWWKDFGPQACKDRPNHVREIERVVANARGDAQETTSRGEAG